MGYVRETETAVRDALSTGRDVLRRAARRTADDAEGAAVRSVLATVEGALVRLDAGEPVSVVTYDVQRAVETVSRRVVDADLAAIRADLDALRELPIARDEELAVPVVDDVALARLADRELSPVHALASVQGLVEAVDVGRSHEAQAVMPLATLSVTEDMATAMRLHASGWRSVYHHERLAVGLAPEDMKTMITQRLRWAQGTLQVMLQENPLRVRGLKLGQRLMYFATMWSYLAGFAAVVYLAAPIIFLCFGVLPVTAWSVDFFVRLMPFFLASQLLFLVAARGVRTWRGQQYSLALFPVWIKACVTAAANVWWSRPLGFAVTPKVRQGGAGSWRLVLPQLTVMVLLVVAAVVGIVRASLGLSLWVGTVVNLLWVAYDLLVLSVVIQGLRYRGWQPGRDEDDDVRHGAAGSTEGAH